jgi:hypothetical protein
MAVEFKGVLTEEQRDNRDAKRVSVGSYISYKHKDPSQRTVLAIKSQSWCKE